MVLDQLVLLLLRTRPLTVCSPWGQRILCCFPVPLGAALTGVAAPCAPVALTRVAAGSQVKGGGTCPPPWPPNSRLPVSVVVVAPYSLTRRLLPPCRGKSVRDTFQCPLGAARTSVAAPRARVALSRVAAVAQVDSDDSRLVQLHKEFEAQLLPNSSPREESHAGHSSSGEEAAYVWRSVALARVASIRA